MDVTIEAYPELEVAAFVTHLPTRAAGDIDQATAAAHFLSLDAAAPLTRSDAVRKAVRDLLRHSGFKPTGRSKPASEYLVKAAGQGKLRSINLAVDCCNAVSLHSGLPISVIDLDAATLPLRIAVAPPGSSYIFNPAGQIIDVGSLLCLQDGKGPCGNAVKDAQRTKTNDQTRRTMSVIWGTTRLSGRTQAAERWYHELLQQAGARIEACSANCSQT